MSKPHPIANFLSENEVHRFEAILQYCQRQMQYVKDLSDELDGDVQRSSTYHGYETAASSLKTLIALCKGSFVSTRSASAGIEDYSRKALINEVKRLLAAPKLAASKVDP